MDSICDATLKLDDRELRCALEEGHDGPVHEDEHGEAWGDDGLSAPPLAAPA